MSQQPAAGCPPTACPPASGSPRLPMFPFVTCGDGPPQLVIRRKHPVVAMPVLPRRRDKVRQTIEELKRRELDDAVGSRPRGLPPTTPPDPVGCLVSGQHVTDATDAAVWPADHAAAHPLGECGQVCGGDWPGRQERRRCVSACFGSSRHEDAVGDAGVQVHVVVERRAKAVQEGDAAEPRTRRTRPLQEKATTNPVRHDMQTARAKPKQRSPHSR